MERKEHPVATIGASGNVLKLLDPDGNPYTPSEPVDYQIIDEDGEVLKEGTIKDTDEISLDDVSAKSFRVMIDSHLVLDTKGFESPVDDEDQKVIDGPSFDPDQASDLDEFLGSEGDQKDGREGVGDDSETKDDSESDNGDEQEGGDDASETAEDDSASGGGDDDKGSEAGESNDSDDKSADSDNSERDDSDSDDSKDSDSQDDDSEGDDSKNSDETDSEGSNDKSSDEDDK